MKFFHPSSLLCVLGFLMLPLGRLRVRVECEGCMRLNKITLAGAAMLLAIGLAACDGTENARTIPTAGPDYVPPALIGPEGGGEQKSGSNGGTSLEGVDPNATTGPNE